MLINSFSEITLLNYYHKSGELILDPEFCLDLMKLWYNNYCFSKKAKTYLFNSDMVLFFIQEAIMEQDIPDILVDQNVRIDYTKLRFLITIDNRFNGNFERLKDITYDKEITSQIVDSFPVHELTAQKNFISLLYYFGLLTIQGESRGKYLLKFQI